MTVVAAAVDEIPGWVQVVLSLAAFATACGVMWAKVLHPIVKVAATGEVMLPLLQDLTVKFRDVPQVFDILREIVGQVRTDSGSSLKDTVNQLEVTLNKVEIAVEQMEIRAMSAAQFLQIGLETDRKLDERDREQMARLLRDQDRLMDRMGVFEKNAAGIARDLADAQRAVDGVAVDLAAAHERADAVVGELPGAAADAASQSPTPEGEL